MNVGTIERFATQPQVNDLTVAWGAVTVLFDHAPDLASFVKDAAGKIVGPIRISREVRAPVDPRPIPNPGGVAVRIRDRPVQSTVVRPGEAVPGCSPGPCLPGSP